MPQFHNPYFFLPVTGGRPDDECVPFDDIAAGKTDNIRHDCYRPGFHTGKITCTLETVTPTFVGNRHIGGIKSISSGHYEHYKINGQPAFPANSLNGMIGSIMEALSRSAMRVIDNQPLSERKNPRNAISAIGRIIKRGDEYFIQPCTIPTTRCFINGDTVSFRLGALWKNVFSGCRLIDVLPAHIHYTVAQNNWNRDTNKHYFIDPVLSDQLSFSDSGDINNVPRDALKIKTITQRDGTEIYFLLGQKPVEPELYSERPDSRYIRGRMRDLNPQGSDDEFYSLHKYERFIPQPETGSERRSPDNICIPSEVIDRYKRIAAHAKKMDAKHPFTPTGYPKLEIEDGMLMFFDIKRQDGRLMVSELSHSSIWRQEFPHQDTEAAIKALKESKNLLPWSSDRTHLTPAEQILGVAAEEDEETEESKVSMLKGRIRFTEASPAQRDTKRLPAQTLKILASPKPPSRYFYFHKKRTDNDGEDHLEINGRKYYLHQQRETVKRITKDKKLHWWETKDTKDISGTIHQKITCRPVDEKQTFHFDIHFNNLGDAELGLLLMALNPGDGFVHRLGLGKPLGLGSVRVSIKQLDFFDAKKSYEVWSDSASDHKKNNEHIEKFKKAAQDADWIDDCILSVLKELGDPDKVMARVTYPVSHKQYDEADKPEGEQKLFRWFVANKNKGNNAQWLMKAKFKETCDSFRVESTLLETLYVKETKSNNGGSRPKAAGRRNFGKRRSKTPRNHRRNPHPKNKK